MKKKTKVERKLKDSVSPMPPAAYAYYLRSQQALLHMARLYKRSKYHWLSKKKVDSK